MLDDLDVGVVCVVVATVPGEGGRVETPDRLRLDELGVGSAVVGKRHRVGLHALRRGFADRLHLGVLVVLVGDLLGHHRRPRGVDLLRVGLAVDRLPGAGVALQRMPHLRQPRGVVVARVRPPAG